MEYKSPPPRVVRRPLIGVYMNVNITYASTTTTYLNDESEIILMSEEEKKQIRKEFFKLLEIKGLITEETTDLYSKIIMTRLPYDGYYYKQLKEKLEELKLKYVVVSGLNDQDTNFSNFLYGHRLYDPRLLLTVAHFMK